MYDKVEIKHTMGFLKKINTYREYMILQRILLASIAYVIVPYTYANTVQPDTVGFTVVPGSEAYYTADIRIAYVSTSTVRGVTSDVSGSIEWINPDSRPTVHAHIIIDASKFDSGNGARDRDVRDMLNVGMYPEITFELKSVLGLDDTPLSEIDGSYVAMGVLTVHGISKEIRVPVHLHYNEESLTVEGSTEAKYTDYGIDPPRVAGFIGRAPDELRLHVKIVAKTRK